MPIMPVPKKEPSHDVKFINLDAPVSPFNGATENTLIQMHEQIKVLNARVATLEATLNALVEVLRAR